MVKLVSDICTEFLCSSTVSSGISGASYYTGTFNTINRSNSGDYVAVSSRGNFYLTWEPGQVCGLTFLFYTKTIESRIRTGMYMYVCVCVHNIYIHTHTHPCIYMYLHMYEYRFTTHTKRTPLCVQRERESFWFMCSLIGNRTTVLVLEEYKTWGGGRMVDYGWLCVVEDCF